EASRGTESKPHSRPYMAYLEIVTSQGKQKACSGFLIRRDFVLTAAHCAGRSVTVTLGAHNIKKKEDTWQRLEVIKQFPYPKYDPVGLHDIMLLKLKEKANLTLAVGTLPLPPHVTFIHPGRMCQVAGVKEPASSTLQEVKLRLMEPRACSHFPAFDHNLQLCGDSGGPLLCAGVAQGIVSYGLSSAKPPAVFTRISPYRPWIDEVLKEN
uniref:Peptidase S1 domain-containing protein n=1 Tax=Capra hircus TaxID=9925 RepID=A0A452FTW1_CAPHI